MITEAEASTVRPTLSLRHAEPEVRVAQSTVHAKSTRFSGRWVIYRKVRQGYRRAGNRMPRFHHDTFEAAEVEAMRLAELHPESTFVILQEQAAVHVRNRT